MSPAHRAHPLAQAIEEAARIFGPEVTAAVLLAAVARCAREAAGADAAHWRAHELGR